MPIKNQNTEIGGIGISQHSCFCLYNCLDALMKSHDICSLVNLSILVMGTTVSIFFLFSIVQIHIVFKVICAVFLFFIWGFITDRFISKHVNNLIYKLSDKN